MPTTGTHRGGNEFHRSRTDGRDGEQLARQRKLSRIRHAAYRCFTEHGYHETTVDNICRAAGISKGSFYWHFNSKQGVFLSILECWTNVVEKELARRFREALSSPDPFASLTESLVDEADRGRHIMPVWLEFLAQVNRDEATREALEAFHARIRAVIADLLRPLVSLRMDEGELQVLSRTVLATFLGLVCQYLTDPDGPSLGEQVRAFMSILRSYATVPVGD